MPRWKTVYTELNQEIVKKPDNTSTDNLVRGEKNSKWVWKMFLVFLAILLIVFAWSVFNYKKATQRAKILAEQNGLSALSHGNPEEIVVKAGRLIKLPTDERPSVAAIGNVAQLQTKQPFYKDAHNGDFLLLYFKAKKAYIYNERENIIVNVGPLSLEKEELPASASTSTTSTP